MSICHPPRLRSIVSPPLPHLLFLSGAATLIGLLAPQSSLAQLDTRGLIGYAVSDVGPKYQDVDQAITRYRNRDYEGALQLLVRAKQKNPELPPAEVMLAKLHFAAKQTAVGQAALERAVRNQPDDPEAYLLLGELSLGEGRVTAAGLLFDRAATTNEKLPDSQRRKRNYQLRIFNGLATVAERREDWAAAESQLAAWVRADPENASAVERLGRARFMQGKYADAQKAFDYAKQKDATRPAAAVLMARLYHQQDKEAEAQKYFEQALAADANNLTTRVAYAQWLLERAEPDKAKAQIAAAAKIDPNSRDTLLLAGLAALMDKDYTGAEANLKSAHLVAPTNVDILSYLALALVAQSDDTKRQQATAFAALAARQDPKNGNLGVTLGWILYQLGRAREAEQSLNNALKTRNLSPDSRYLIAQVFFDRGRNQPATQLLDTALKSNGIFVYRREAQALADKLKASGGK
jgi:uncharacterized protein (TIGR02996 family)